MNQFFLPFTIKKESLPSPPNDFVSVGKMCDMLTMYGSLCE